MSAAPQQLLIFGATSGIARAWCRLKCADGVHFHLVGRSTERLEQVADDLLARGAGACKVYTEDLSRSNDLSTLCEQLFVQGVSYDHVLLAQGVLGKQEALESAPLDAVSLLRVNFEAQVYLLLELAKHLEQQGRGMVSVLGSVAGDRGRAGNYIYAASKAGLEAFCSGLAVRLQTSGIHLIFFKPGPVHTAMTEGMQLGLTASTPERIAKGMLRAQRRGKNVAYLPIWWGWIMCVIALLPEGIFRRLFPWNK